jgi:biopolymer transport protein ExbB
VEGFKTAGKTLLPHLVLQLAGKPDADHEINIFGLIERGGFVMWPLLAVSVISLAITLERLWFWSRINSGREKTRIRKLLRALRNGDRSRAEECLEEPGGVYDQLARKMLEEGPDDAIALETIEDLRGITERFSGILSTIVTASPMLGILGTVTGIIQSFELLGGARTIVDPRDVSGGIAEALITTAAGLIIALATLFPYMIFKTQADRALGRFEAIVTAAKQGLGPTRNWSVKK